MRPARASSSASRAPLRRWPWVAVALLAAIAAVVALARPHGSKPVQTVAPPPEIKVLVAEGKTRAQIAQSVSSDGLNGSYLAASVRSPLLAPAVYGAPAGTPDLEGFLFPATYDMFTGAPASKLVEEQLVAFKESFGAAQIAAARALHVTPYQLLIVASMVEREAVIPSDRPKIAAVIYNRLAAGMPLGIDATIYYAVELASGVATYTGELTEAQLHIDSPYNTRTHVGLPPTPISNPGLASIEAAAHPAHVAYLYYVAGADGCGEQVFSDTPGGIRSRRRSPTAKRWRAAAGTRRRAGASDEAPACLRPRRGCARQAGRSRLAASRTAGSPAMHNAAFRALGMEGWRYQRLPVPPALFEQTVRALAQAGFVGANVTIPHKLARARARDLRDRSRQREIGAANTLTFAGEGDDRGREHRRSGADRSCWAP